MHRLVRPLLASGILAAAAAWLWLGKLGFLPKPFCPLRRLTGIPCPGCGGTRAAMMLMDGRFLEALQANPLSVLLIAFLGIVAITAWIDAITGRNRTDVLLHTKWPVAVTLPLFALIAATWVRNILGNT